MGKVIITFIQWSSSLKYDSIEFCWSSFQGQFKLFFTCAIIVASSTWIKLFLKQNHEPCLKFPIKNNNACPYLGYRKKRSIYCWSFLFSWVHAPHCRRKGKLSIKRKSPLPFNIAHPSGVFVLAPVQGTPSSSLWYLVELPSQRKAQPTFAITEFWI